MDYISVKTAFEKWGISERRIQKLCEENRIKGIEDTEKQSDARYKKYRTKAANNE